VKTARQSESRIARYEQKSEEGRSGVQRAKRERKRQNEGERPREFPKLPLSPFQAPNRLFASRPIFSKPWNAHLDSGRTGTQTETNYATAVGVRGDRENPSGQKSSHLFFVRRSLCQETPNKEGATVITPFLPPGFSRVSARKTRQPEPSRSDPTRALRIKYSQEEGPRHISQGLTKFD
jgi:hypothetical protein